MDRLHIRSDRSRLSLVITSNEYEARSGVHGRFEVQLRQHVTQMRSFYARAMLPQRIS